MLKHVCILTYILQLMLGSLNISVKATILHWASVLVYNNVWINYPKFCTTSTEYYCTTTYRKCNYYTPSVVLCINTCINTCPPHVQSSSLQSLKIETIHYKFSSSCMCKFPVSPVTSSVLDPNILLRILLPSIFPVQQLVLKNKLNKVRTDVCPSGLPARIQDCTFIISRLPLISLPFVNWSYLCRFTFSWMFCLTFDIWQLCHNFTFLFLVTNTFQPSASILSHPALYYFPCQR